MRPDHARPDELPAALALVFQHLREDERRARTLHALELIERGDLDARGVFVLRGEAGVGGALVCATVEGSGSLIWPPSIAAHAFADLAADAARRASEGEPQSLACASGGEGPGRGEYEDALIRAACAWLRGQGARLTQALLPPAEVPLAAPLLRNGFRHVTGLSYLQHPLSLRSSLFAPSSRLRFEPYRPDWPDEFHQTLERTYEGTLDCPEVNGVRDIGEVIRGHKAQGRFEPTRWWLARLDGEAAGVMLLMEQPDSGDWEVGYMGIVPAFRRRGLGREMLLHALREAKAGGAARVTLSVDDRNVPAWSLYRAAGFEPYDHRAVFLALWQ